MRQTAGEQGIFESPSDLRYLEPLPGSSLNDHRNNQMVFQGSKNATSAYAIVEEFRPRADALTDFHTHVHGMLEHASSSGETLRSFAALKYLEEYEDDSMAILSVHASREDRDQWAQQPTVTNLKYVTLRYPMIKLSC